VVYLDYDYEKENFKVCAACEVAIEYHVTGFTHTEPENLWYHRDHSGKEIQATLNRKLTKKEIHWIDEGK
jgi:hypothetical protein